MIMKKSRRLAIATLGALCLLSSSCSLDAPQQAQPPVYYGEFPVEMINNTTGETEEHTMVMAVYFWRAGMECYIETGIAGLLGANRHIYEARWDSDKDFSLFERWGDSARGPRYLGSLDGDRMTLKKLDDAGEVADTYELKKR